MADSFEVRVTGGTGGSGKSSVAASLARHIAAGFPGDVSVVELDWEE